MAWDMDDLQLDPVRVVEEHRVVARHVRVLLRAALDLGPCCCSQSARSSTAKRDGASNATWWTPTR
jgi:hypothetical protein